MEEVSALTLCYLVQCIPDEGAKRLDQFGEHSDVEGGVREASSTEVPCEEGLEDESMHENNREDADDEDTDDEDVDEESESSSGSVQESPCSTCHNSDRHHHPCSWDEQSKSGTEGMVPVGDSLQDRTVEVRGRVKQGIHQP